MRSSSNIKSGIDCLFLTHQATGILLFFAFFPISLIANDLELSVKSSFESEYVFRGKGIAGPSIQPSIDFSLDSVYWGIWLNESVENQDQTAREIDLYVGTGSSIARVLDYDFGLTYYAYPKRTSADNSLEVFAGTSLELAFQPAVYLYYDFDLKRWTFIFTSNYLIELDNITEGLSLEPSWEWGYTKGSGEDEGFYGTAYLDLVHQITDHVTFRIGTRFSSAEKSIDSRHQHHLWWGCRFVSAF